MNREKGHFDLSPKIRDEKPNFRPRKQINISKEMLIHVGNRE